MGRYIDITSHDDKKFTAYLAEPPAGSGPGLVLLQEIFGINAYMREMADLYAEEGYAVLVPDLFWRIEPGVELSYSEKDMGHALELYKKFDTEAAINDIDSTIKTLVTLSKFTQGVGLVGYCLGGKLAYLAALKLEVNCAVSYYGVGIQLALDQADKLRVPCIFHLAELDEFCDTQARQEIISAFADNPAVTIYQYPTVDHAFATTGRETFNASAAMLAYSRTLGLLRKVLGPVYDLSSLWEEHLRHEFETRDVASTMKTMVAEPYVNHIPTLTGGVGYKNLSRFYQYHFVHNNPADTEIIGISLTIGSDRVVDEFIMRFTHDCEIDWLLPGIAPTGKLVEIPMIAIVNFRGNKLYNEHIYWDQASVLAQIGLLDISHLPVSGKVQADKLLDKTLPSNELMPTWKSSENKKVPGLDD